MRNLKSLAAVFIALVMAACGDSTLVPNGSGPINPGGGPGVAGVTVLTSSPSLESSPGSSVTIQVIVRDTNNVAMEGVTVILAADSGTLTVTNPTTDQSGIVSATLGNGGDPTPRTITIRRTHRERLGSVGVNVAGTQIDVTGPTQLAQGDTETYTVVLLDSAGDGISGETVDVTSASGNTLSAAMLTTDGNGQAQFDVTASAAGADTLTATALGISGTRDISVSNDTFVLTAPVAGDQILLNTPGGGITDLDDRRRTAGRARRLRSALRAARLSALSAVTDAAGTATVSIQSTNAGPAQITAQRNASGTSTSVDVQFVADQPASDRFAGESVYARSERAKPDHGRRPRRGGQPGNQFDGPFRPAGRDGRPAFGRLCPDRPPGTCTDVLHVQFDDQREQRRGHYRHRAGYGDRRQRRADCRATRGVHLDRYRQLDLRAELRAVSRRIRNPGYGLAG